jgi:hypothetical protein
MNRRLAFCLTLLLAFAPAGAMAASPHPQPLQTSPLMLTPPALCEAAIAGAEAQQRLPVRVLHSIALRESGRADPETGHIRPWPWTINFEGTGHFYDSKEDAIAAVRQIQAAGGQSIDVGCMQVNLMHHPTAFTSLEDAFDPISNAAYAGRFLRSLFAEMNDWGSAIAAYHSRTPGLGEAYRDLVLAVWNPSDPAVLARLNNSSIPSLSVFPVAFFPTVSSSTIPVWSPVPAGPALLLRQYGGQHGSAYRSFLPPSAIYADFSPKPGRRPARPRMAPLDVRLSTGLVEGGLVVPKGVAVRGATAAPRPAAAKSLAPRSGQAG